MDVTVDELADRIRALIGSDRAIEEQRMFGARVFLLEGRILVGARKGGILLVRVREESGAALLTRPGVAQAVMGKKQMGPTWLDVDRTLVADDADLLFWLDVARDDAVG